MSTVADNPVVIPELEEKKPTTAEPPRIRCPLCGWSPRLEVIIKGIRIVNIYLPNGNPVGSDKFAYKLAWMDRLNQQIIRWRQDDVPTLIGGDFNVIPEDIDCHKPSSWEHDALFQPEPRARYRAMLGMGYTDAFRSLHMGEIGHFTFWDYFRQAFRKRNLSSSIALRVSRLQTFDYRPRHKQCLQGVRRGKQ